MNQAKHRRRALEILAHRQARMTQQGDATERLRKLLKLLRGADTIDDRGNVTGALLEALAAILEQGSEAAAAACLQDLGEGRLCPRRKGDLC